MNRSDGWLLFRILYLIVAALCAPWLVKHGQADFDKYGFSLGSAIGIMAFACFGVVLVLFLQYNNKYSAEQWERPSWFVSPGNSRQPIQSMHLGAWTLIVLGIASAIYTAVTRTHTLLFTWPLFVGFSLYAGVWLSVFLFKDKFATSPK